jgi:hypothetical protein
MRVSGEILMGRHPILDALWESLPPACSPWPAEEQEAWLRVARAVLPLVYPGTTNARAAAPEEPS